MYRAKMGVPPMPDEGAPGPMTRAQRMAPISIGSPGDLTPEQRKRFSRMPMEPVEGEEVGMEEKKSKVYKKKLAMGGSALSGTPYSKSGGMSPYSSDDEEEKPNGYAKGGSASSRADGCAQRGKTRGKMV